MAAREPILVTGAAGFIGFHVARRLLQDGRTVVGLDSMSSYYDPSLKEARREILSKFDTFRFCKLDLADRAGTAALFAEHRYGQDRLHQPGDRAVDIERISVREQGRNLD